MNSNTTNTSPQEQSTPASGGGQNVKAHRPAEGAAKIHGEAAESERTLTPAAGGGLGAAPCSAVTSGDREAEPSEEPPFIPPLSSGRVRQASERERGTWRSSPLLQDSRRVVKCDMNTNSSGKDIVLHPNTDFLLSPSKH